MVGRADDQGAVGEARAVQSVQHRADALVERARTRLESRHVLAGQRGVGQALGRLGVERVANRGWRREAPVCLEETDREEEGLRRAVDRLGRGGHTFSGMVRVDLVDLVVADRCADRRRCAARRSATSGSRPAAGRGSSARRSRSATSRGGRGPASRSVAVLAGEERRAAARAGGRCAERLPEEHALVSQELDVRRRDAVAVRLDVAAGVVRVDIDDVRRSVLPFSTRIVEKTSEMERDPLSASSLRLCPRRRRRLRRRRPAARGPALSGLPGPRRRRGRSCRRRPGPGRP